MSLLQLNDSSSMSEPHTLASVNVNEPHSGNSSVSEPHTCGVNVSEPHTLAWVTVGESQREHQVVPAQP